MTATNPNHIYRDFQIGSGAVGLGFTFAHKEYTGDSDDRIGHEDTVDACEQRIDEWWDERTILALRGLVGLIEIVSRRDDMPPAIRDVLATNHRIVEAREVIAGQLAVITIDPPVNLLDAVRAARAA